MNAVDLVTVRLDVQGRGKSSGSLETMYATTNGNHCKQGAKQCWELSRHKGGDFPAGQISRPNALERVNVTGSVRASTGSSCASMPHGLPTMPRASGEAIRSQVDGNGGNGGNEARARHRPSSWPRGQGRGEARTHRRREAPRTEVNRAACPWSASWARW